MKNVFKYLWRDKIDLIMFVATATIATVFVLKDPTFDNCWLAMCALWMFGAIYRMGFYTDRR
jgi:hypothetical protein